MPSRAVALRVVLDTSSLVSYVLTCGVLMRRVMAHWRAGSFTAISSPLTRGELEAVLARPRIRRLATTDLDQLVLGMERFSEHVPGTLLLPGVCRDAKDDPFVACAVEGRANYLLTSDRGLLDLWRHEEVAFVNPGQLVLAIELSAMTPDQMATRFTHGTLAYILAHVPLDMTTTAGLNEAVAATGTIRP